MNEIAIVISILETITALFKSLPEIATKAAGAVESLDELLGILKKVNTTRADYDAAIAKRDASLKALVENTNS